MVQLKNSITHKTTTMSKALDLLKSNKTLSERAADLLPSVEREVKQKFIIDLKSKIEGVEDRLADAKLINLKTNLNEGQTAHSREECKERLMLILELEYQLVILKRELKIKTRLYLDYFKAASTEELP